MSFQSILFNKPSAADTRSPAQAPEFFGDLNLDQMVTSVTAGREEYDLEGFFHTPLPDMDGVRYRHKIFRDLEREALRAPFIAFAKKMREMRTLLTDADQSSHVYASQGWFLEAAAVYCEAVGTLNHDLQTRAPESEGLIAFREYLAAYADSQDFLALVDDTRQRQSDLAAMRYCVLIHDLRVTVSRYEDEADYSAEVAETFARFKQGEAQQYRQELDQSTRLNQVEVRILIQVAKLYPKIFAQLEGYCTSHSDYLDSVIARFDREIQFYFAYKDYMARIEAAGLAFCYPQMTEDDKATHDNEGFDLVLANKLVHEHTPVVTNDFHLEAPERLIVVSGPNQGGKTTFARMFGQLHYLARLGCPVPGREARLFFYDRLFTHFERAENIQNLRGKLEDDLVRVHEILENATANSIVIMNEIFSSTTSQDACFLGEKVLWKLIERQTLGLCVTFIDELASLSDNTVSMASTVEPDNPADRTFKILRKPADGLAYARALAVKHRLTRAALRDRL